METHIIVYIVYQLSLLLPSSSGLYSVYIILFVNNIDSFRPIYSTWYQSHRYPKSLNFLLAASVLFFPSSLFSPWPPTTFPLLSTVTALARLKLSLGTHNSLSSMLT